MLLDVLLVLGARLPVGLAAPADRPAGHVVAVPNPEQQGALRAVDILVQLAGRVDDERARRDWHAALGGVHFAAALKAEVDLGGVGVAVVGADLAGLPAGDGEVAAG